MAWTYNYFGVGSSQKDQLRLMIGDTLDSDQQFQDEELITFLAGRANLFGAAADACRSLATKFSRSVTIKGAGSQANYSDLSKQYARMAIRFDIKASTSGAAKPYAGGMRVSDKIAQDQDTDRVKPQFNIGVDDNNNVPFGAAANQTEEDASTLGGE